MEYKNIYVILKSIPYLIIAFVLTIGSRRGTSQLVKGKGKMLTAIIADADRDISYRKTACFQ